MIDKNMVIFKSLKKKLVCRNLNYEFNNIYLNTVKPVYKGHSREPANVSCPLHTAWLKLYTLFQKGKNETALYTQ
jgi:hypothetical protein